MALTVIVTRDVTERFRGFLASSMLEVAPALYVSPRMNPRVRERIWSVLAEWHRADCAGGIVMVWRDPAKTGGVGIAHLGTPPRELVEIDGMWITRRSR
jgi:CRISPR-associated protein Cas2